MMQKIKLLNKQKNPKKKILFLGYSNTQTKIIDELIKISHINNTSLLLATHDLVIAKKMDKIYKLNDGLLLEHKE